MLRAETRARRESNSRENQAQNEIDRNVMAYFHSLPMVGDNGQDQASIDVYGGLFLDARKRVRDELRGAQHKIGRQRDKDSGVSLQNFEATIKADIDSQKLAKGRRGADADAERYGAYMRQLYQQYRDDPKNEGKPQPPSELVQKWRGDALMYGEERPEDVLFLQHNDRAFNFLLKGQKYTTAGFEEKNRLLLEQLGADASGGAAQAAAAPAPAAPAEKVRVRKPDGTTGTMAAGDAAAWVKAHPDWAVLP